MYAPRNSNLCADITTHSKRFNCLHRPTQTNNEQKNIDTFFHWLLLFLKPAYVMWSRMSGTVSETDELGRRWLWLNPGLADRGMLTTLPTAAHVRLNFTCSHNGVPQFQKGPALKKQHESIRSLEIVHDSYIRVVTIKVKPSNRTRSCSLL